jgi:hypothetical protein
MLLQLQLQPLVLGRMSLTLMLTLTRQSSQQH